MTILRTMRNFSSMNIAASILLFVAAIAAAIIANSPVAPVYQAVSYTHLRAHET